MKNTKEIVLGLHRIKIIDSTRRKKNVLFNIYKNNKKNVIKFLQFVYSPYIVYNISTPKEDEFAVLDNYFKIPVNNLKILLERIDDLFLVRKLRGNAGKKALIDLNNSCTQDTKILLKMILDRDLDIGLGVRSINEVIPGCIPVAEYMGAVGFSGFDDLIDRTTSSFDGNDLKLDEINSELIIGLVQAKADGLFAFGDIQDQTFISRRLKEISFVDKNIRTQINKFRIYGQKNGYLDKKESYTLHGELTIDGIPNRLEANGVFKALTTLAIKEKEDPEKFKAYQREFQKVFGITDKEMRKKIRYTVWDLTYSRPNVGNYSRFESLKNLLTDYKEAFPQYDFINLIECKYIRKNNLKEIVTFFEEQLLNGDEGIIYKVGFAKFETGHSVNCIKFKNIFDFDLKVVGFEEGKRKNTLGALVCESSDGMVKTNLSGLDKDLKKEIWENQEKYLGMICEGEANDITKSDKNEHFSLMHPRFLTFREDKTEADNLEKIQQSRNSFKLIPNLYENLKEVLEKKCTTCEGN